MNYGELFIQLQKQIKQVEELIMRSKMAHTNVREIFKMIEKINKKLDKKKGD